MRDPGPVRLGAPPRRQHGGWLLDRIALRLQHQAWSAPSLDRQPSLAGARGAVGGNPVGIAGSTIVAFEPRATRMDARRVLDADGLVVPAASSVFAIEVGSRRAPSPISSTSTPPNCRGRVDLRGAHVAGARDPCGPAGRPARDRRRPSSRRRSGSRAPETGQCTPPDAPIAMTSSTVGPRSP